MPSKMSRTYEHSTPTKKLTPLPAPITKWISYKKSPNHEPDLNPVDKKKLHDCLYQMLIYLDPAMNEQELDIDLYHLANNAKKVMNKTGGIYESIAPVRTYLNDASMCWEALKKAEQPGSTLRPDFWRSKFRESVKNAGIACQAMLKE
jgi:hypothetical protein